LKSHNKELTNFTTEYTITNVTQVIIKPIITVPRLLGRNERKDKNEEIIAEI
jgi:hypothetical protein